MKAKITATAKYLPKRTTEKIPGMVTEKYILQNKYLLN